MSMPAGLPVDMATTETKQLTHHYAPRGSAVEVLQSRDAEVVMSGPAGTGKSRGCLEKLLLQALKYPGMRGLILRKTQVSLGSSALKTWRRDVAGEALANRTLWFYGGSAEEPAQYRFANGSTILVGGMDKPTKIMSTEYDCVVGDTLVDSPSPVERAYGRPYSGELVTITTARGNELTGTPNHPVLTDQGWVGLGSLREGDHVISRVRREPLTAHPDPQITDQPTPIREVASALALAGGGHAQAERVETVPMDFHGDGSYGYVDVVTAARLLDDTYHATLGEPVPHDQRGRTHLEQSALMSNRTGVELPPGGAPSLVARPLFAPEPAHPLAVGVGSAPGLVSALPGGSEICLPLRVNPHPGLPIGERVGGRLPRDAAGGHLTFQPRNSDADRERRVAESALSGEVAPDRIVKIGVTDAGRGRHVYNLQTVDSWYYANEIVSHNCIYAQEATELTVTDWEYALTRLRNHRMPYQQIIADCNPDAPTHWLKARCDKGTAKMIFCRHEDNPVLFDELLGADGTSRFELTEVGAEYMAKLDSLTGVRYLRLRKGLWVAAEGVIFDEFAPEMHVIDEMPAGWESWPRYWSVDFGFTNPFVCQMWAQDTDGRLYLYREFYMTQRTVDQHARDILKVITTTDRYGNVVWNEPHPYTILADHDAENRARFENEIGQGTTAADKNVKDGIEVTQARFRKADDGKPRVFFLRHALVERDSSLKEARKPTCTLEELPGYVWAPSPDGRAVKEEPLKLNDHGMDAMRYLMKDQDPLARPGIRIM